MLKEKIEINGVKIPVMGANTIIVGAGAAGMNCAVQLVKFWRSRGVADPAKKLLVVTGGLKLGASRMSGSDKQTYYKMGTSPRVADTAEDFAKSLTSFGCTHGDNALIEGICSLRGFYNLVEVGVPFPHDPFGAFIGYKTDHDPYERATSAGPKTSRFMSECLQAQLERAGVQLVDKHPVVQFITDGEGDAKRIVALACIDRSRASDESLGLSILVAENWVLAAGGAGEIYKTSVYPRGQFGIHAPALEAGLEACNLTESQYGLASIKFRWNVSGTYMQVIPRIYSTDADGGDEQEFLTEYFDDMASMATNIFLKGYQWPFDAQRITDHNSSLVDMAVHQETVVRGRRVWMDFLRDPVGGKGWDEFSIDALGDEAKDYLAKTGASQATPIERLQHMNTPAIEIYSENGIDLTSEPLEIAVCAQHHNGGLVVNKWWQSNIAHTFVIGEMGGTHGVKRPGGSALNAGQVGGMRAAEYITAVYGDVEPDLGKVQAVVSDGAKQVLARLVKLRDQSSTAECSVTEAMEEIRQRMTQYGAHLRSKAGAKKALDEAVKQFKALQENGMKLSDTKHLDQAVTTLQQALTQIAMLKAICGMFDLNAGSRGSHCLLDEAGIEMHPNLIDPATDTPYRFKEENQDLRNSILYAKYNGDAEYLFDLHTVEPRPIPDRDIAFEPAWAEYREGKIFEI